MRGPLCKSFPSSLLYGPHHCPCHTAPMKKKTPVLIVLDVRINAPVDVGDPCKVAA